MYIHIYICIYIRIHIYTCMLSLITADRITDHRWRLNDCIDYFNRSLISFSYVRNMKGYARPKPPLVPQCTDTSSGGLRPPDEMWDGEMEGFAL
jgi:hypothetical protein